MPYLFQSSLQFQRSFLVFREAAPTSAAHHVYMWPYVLPPVIPSEAHPCWHVEVSLFEGYRCPSSALYLSSLK